ncbi:MAG: hypothetical protein J0L75_14105 [Spirochaetes bacterium]|nr:hypothetical protein [Spirochaetota bacterium]
MKKSPALSTLAQWTLDQERRSPPNVEVLWRDFEARLAAPTPKPPRLWPQLAFGLGMLSTMAALIAVVFLARPRAFEAQTMARSVLAADELKAGVAYRFENAAELRIPGHAALSIDRESILSASKENQVSLGKGRVSCAKASHVCVVVPLKNGPVRVQGMGAVFAVERQPTFLEVTVDLGPVSLTVPGEGGRRVLGPGSHLRLPLETSADGLESALGEIVPTETPALTEQTSGRLLFGREGTPASLVLASRARSGAWRVALHSRSDARGAYTLAVPRRTEGTFLYAWVDHDGDGRLGIGDELGILPLEPTARQPEAALLPVLGQTRELAALTPKGDRQAWIKELLVKYLLSGSGWNALPGTTADDALRAAFENGLARSRAPGFYLVGGSDERLGPRAAGVQRLVAATWSPQSGDAELFIAEFPEFP